MLTRALAPALLVGVVLSTAAACGEESPTAGAGGAGGLSVLEGSDARDVTGTEVPVLVPNGAFVFTVAEPRTELPDEVGDPAAGGSDTAYVGIAWRPDGNAPELGPVLHGTAPLPAPVRVVQGEESAAVTELGADTVGGNANGVVWVAVEEDGPGPVLEVEYDGLVQTFDLTTGAREPGPADGFYADTGTARVECLGVEPVDRHWRLDVRCEVSDVAAVPYVAGHGWAGAGRTWLVLGLTLTPADLTRTGAAGDADYEVLSQEGTVRAGGEAAVVLSEDASLGHGWSAGLAVPVDADAPVTLDVRRTYRLALDAANGSDGPGNPTLTYAATIDLPPSSP